MAKNKLRCRVRLLAFDFWLIDSVDKNNWSLCMLVEKRRYRILRATEYYVKEKLNMRLSWWRQWIFTLLTFRMDQNMTTVIFNVVAYCHSHSRPIPYIKYLPLKLWACVYTIYIINIEFVDYQISNECHNFTAREWLTTRYAHWSQLEINLHVYRHQGAGWFNVNMSLYPYRKSHLEIRLSYERLISTMGYPIVVKWLICIESGPFI